MDQPKQKRISLTDLQQGIGDVSRPEFRALVGAVISLQNTVRSIMEQMDHDNQLANANADTTSQNFIHLLAAVKVVADTVGIEIQGINKAAAKAVDDRAAEITEPTDDKPKTVH